MASPQTFIFTFYIELQGGPIKTGPVWVLITLRWLVVERRVICQKFQNASKKNCLTCIADYLN